MESFIEGKIRVIGVGSLSSYLLKMQVVFEPAVAGGRGIF